MSDSTHPNVYLHKVFQWSGPPGGDLKAYDYMIVYFEMPGADWLSAEENSHDHLKENENPSKNCHGMLWIGLEVQFYKYDKAEFSRIGERMHVVDDAGGVMTRAEKIRKKALLFV